MSKMDIPYRLKKFPLYHGMLVHHTVFVGGDGIPDFKVVNVKNRMEALRNKLCHLCGEKLGVHMVFIGGPLSVQKQSFYDGPMHEDCALYAAKVCPFLSLTDWGHAKQPARHSNEEGTIIRTIKNMVGGRPDRMAFYYTKGYTLIIDNNNNIFIKAAAPTKIDWNIMPSKVMAGHHETG